MRYLALALLVLGVALALLAWGIWFVSDAHGHGLASQDRAAIVVVASASAAALLSAIAAFARRFFGAGGD